jgi:hypothetical protein
MKKNETLNLKTGEITEKPLLNEVIIRRHTRSNGSIREQQDFSNCPTLAEQHTAHLTDINYLIEKYRPDELAAYIAARSSYRQEILGHDFSQEPSLQDAKNAVYSLNKHFDELNDDIKRNFKNAVEFYKFIDNPANAEKMVKLGLLTKKEVTKLTTDSMTTTQESETVKESKTSPSLS